MNIEPEVQHMPPITLYIQNVRADVRLAPTRNGMSARVTGLKRAMIMVLPVWAARSFWALAI